MQPQYPQQYQPQPQQYYQAPPPPRGPPINWRRVFGGRNIAAMVLALIAGILILVSYAGAWCSGSKVETTVEATGVPTTKTTMEYDHDADIGDLIDLPEGRGAKYNTLYLMIPAGVIVLVFGILTMFGEIPVMSKVRKPGFILVLVFSIIALAVSIVGIALVATETWESTSPYTFLGYTVTTTVKTTLKLGAAGFVGLVGGILGLIGGILYKPSGVRAAYPPAPTYAPPPSAPPYYQQPPAPPRQYP